MDVSKEDIYVVTKRVRKWPIKTTVDWKILVQFEDKYEYLIHLKDMKESHPVEFGDFYKARGITDEPTFFMVVSIYPEEDRWYSMCSQASHQKYNPKVWYWIEYNCRVKYQDWNK